MNAKLINILLADDTVIAREGWKKILETIDDLKVVGEATTAQEVLKKVKETNPDILLMDLRWGVDDTAGWTAILEVKREYPKVRVIAITAYEQLVRDARKAGADAALLKTFTREELLIMIRELASRKENFKVPAQTPFEILTTRELEVLQMIAKGNADKEIALLLNIAPTTVKNHVKSILEKLGAKNRTQASHIAREMGLIRET
jgi:DNA-binding NarL/FixJ family response regulator